MHVLNRHRKSSRGLTFGWRDGSRIVDDDEDKDHNDQMEDPDYNPSNDGYDSEDSDKDN